MKKAQKAVAIRRVAENEHVLSVIDAARVLPLVAWDVELALEYLMEEGAAAAEAADALTLRCRRRCTTSCSDGYC